MQITEAKAMIESGVLDDKFMELYVDCSRLAQQKKRYIKAIEEFKSIFSSSEINYLAHRVEAKL